MVDETKHLNLRMFSCRSPPEGEMEYSPNISPDSVSKFSTLNDTNIKLLCKSREKYYKGLSQIDRMTMRKLVQNKDPRNVHWFKQRLIYFQKSPDKNQRHYNIVRNVKRKRRAKRDKS